MKTIDFYNANSTKLIYKYNNADMSTLHTLLLTYIPKNSDILDIDLSVSKSSSTIIISYSMGNKADDERYFENVDLDYITQLFNKKSFTLVEIVKSRDSLKRDSLT